MINKLKSIELEYVRCFASEKNFDSHIEFYDKKFRNTYTGNVTVLNKSLDDSELLNLINREINYYKKQGRCFLNFEINGKVEKSIIRKLSKVPDRIDRFDYLLIESKRYTSINKKNDAVLKKVCSQEEYKNLIDINVKDNTPILGRSYSIQRIKRKVQVYKDKENNLDSYICYYKDKAIGSYELLIKNNICKIEDFVILKEYRGKGFGTHIIREILKDNYEKGIESTYLIAEKNGEAEKLYERLGFIKIGEKTQLIW